MQILYIFLTHWVIETNLINKFAAYDRHDVPYCTVWKNHLAVIYNWEKIKIMVC